MTDITKLKVLKSFVKYHKLSWADFVTKGIYLNIDGGSERAKSLGAIVKELEDAGIIKRLPPPIAWEISDINKTREAIEQLEEIEELQIMSNAKQWYETENAKRHFEDYPTMKKLALGAFVISVVSILVTLLVAIFDL